MAGSPRQPDQLPYLVLAPIRPSSDLIALWASCVTTFRYLIAVVEPLVAFQPRPGTAEAQHFIFGGREPERLGDPTEVNESSRLEWVPLSSVPDLIDSGDMWDGGTQLALLRQLMRLG